MKKRYKLFGETCLREEESHITCTKEMFCFSYFFN